MSLWIRVETSIGDSAKVRRFAAALNLPPEAAVGLLVMTWGQVAEHAGSGDVGEVPDDLLEEWARWRGRRGRFAKAFRSHFAPEGQINDWEKHQGKLIERRERDRERWEKRRHSAGVRAEPPEEHRRSGGGVSAEPHPPTEDGRRTDTVTETPPTSQRARLAARLVGEPGRESVMEFLDQLPPGERVTKWEAVLNGCLDGLGLAGGQPATASELAAACTDYRQTAPEQWGLIHFRSFVDRIVGRRLRTGRTAGSRPENEFDEAIAEAKKREAARAG